MPRLGIGIDITSNKGPFWNIQNDLALHYTSRSGSEFLEIGSGSNLNAKILSPCYKGDSTGYYTITSTSLGSSHTIRFGADLYQLSGTGAIMQFGSTGAYLTYEKANNRFNYRVNSTNNYISYTATSGYKDYRIERVGVDITLFVNNVSSGSVALSAPNNLSVSVNQLFKISTTYFNAPILYLAVDSVFYVHFNDPSKPHDLSGNQKQFNNVTITSANKSYMHCSGLVGTGFSTWIKSGSSNIYLAYFNGLPVSSPTALYLTGYTHESDTALSISSLIIAPDHYIDFNPASYVNTDLNNLDRSNTTIHNISARGSDYMVSYPYAWLISSISDPYIYYSWKNVGYKGKLHSKITNNSDTITLLSESLVYSIDKKGSNENNIQKYCTINKFTTPTYGTFTVDENGYVNLLREVNSSDFGTSPSLNAYQNYNIIESLINNSRYTKVTIGNDPEQIITISQPIITVHEQDLDINCSLQPMPGLSGTVAIDIAANDTSFTANDASDFNIGEWIGVTDDDAIQVYDTYRAWAGQITNIVGNVITLDHKSYYSYSISKNARFAHIQNVIIVNSDNVNINILGEINGKKTSHVQLHPVREEIGSVTEQQRCGCGVTFWKCSGGSIDGIVKDCLLHNVAITGETIHDVSNITVKSNAEFTGGHDKNLVIKFADSTIIESGGKFNNADWEDGVTFYSLNTNATVGTIECKNNTRDGFTWNNECAGLNHIGTIMTESNGDFGVNIRGGSANIDNIIAIDRVKISFEYSDAEDIDINSLSISSVVETLSTPILLFYGNIKRVNIDELIITGCTGVGIKSEALSGLYPDDVTINGGGIYNHTGTKFDIAVGSDIVFTNFENYP